MTQPEKLCVFCRNWYFSGGSPGYSEMTPGSDASMRCTKGHRIGDISEMSTAEFRDSILTAEKCPDYVPPEFKSPC